MKFIKVPMVWTFFPRFYQKRPKKLVIFIDWQPNDQFGFNASDLSNCPKFQFLPPNDCSSLFNFFILSNPLELSRIEEIMYESNSNHLSNIKEYQGNSKLFYFLAKPESSEKVRKLRNSFPIRIQFPYNFHTFFLILFCS